MAHQIRKVHEGARAPGRAQSTFSKTGRYRLSHGFIVRSFCIKYFASPAAGYPNLPLQLMAQKARVMRVYEGRRRCIAMSLARQILAQVK